MSICEWTLLWRKEHTTSCFTSSHLDGAALISHKSLIFSRQKIKEFIYSSLWSEQIGINWNAALNCDKKIFENKSIKICLNCFKHIVCCHSNIGRARSSQSDGGNHFGCCQLFKIEINPPKSHNKNAWDFIIHIYFECRMVFPRIFVPPSLPICYGWRSCMRATRLSSAWILHIGVWVRVCLRRTKMLLIFFWFLFRIAMHFSSVQFVLLNTRVPVNLSQPSLT